MPQSINNILILAITKIKQKVEYLRREFYKFTRPNVLTLRYFIIFS
jgi:hypothetical protein